MGKISINLNSKKATLGHKQLIQSNQYLALVYTHFYSIIKDSCNKGKVIELGSGGGFIKKIVPSVTTSDVIIIPGVDIVLNAERINLRKNSVDSFVMLNVFHHIKNPEKALVNMQESLKPKGRIVMIEPYNSLWGKFIYQNFHHETFDPKANWEIKGKGRMSDANGALPWIVFQRDREIFQAKFPKLRIKEVTPHTPIQYLISGGLTRPSFVSHRFFNLFQRIEQIVSPLNPFVGMFVTIVIEKKSFRANKQNVRKRSASMKSY